MDLFTFLIITIILCSLILLVQADGNRTIQVMSVVAIAVEILLILHVKEAVDLSLSWNLNKVIPCLTGVVGLTGLFKMQERSIPLLIFFTSLVQFFMEMNIIDSIR